MVSGYLLANTNLELHSVSLYYFIQPALPISRPSSRNGRKSHITTVARVALALSASDKPSSFVFSSLCCPEGFSVLSQRFWML